MMIRKLLVSVAALALMTGAAWAADLPNTKGPPAFAPPPPPAFTWSGFYIGGQVGYQWGTASNSLIFLPTGASFPLNSVDTSGVVGGGHLGFNYQVSQFVFGLEGDVEGATTSGSSFQPLVGATGTGNARLQASIRGRLGFAWDRVLIYATGGGAYASINATSSSVLGFDSETTGRFGWTVGGGVEYAIDPNWLIRVEYRYSDYGSFDFPLINETAGLFADRIHVRDNRVEAGFSYKFDMFEPPAPVVAKY